METAMNALAKNKINSIIDEHISTLDEDTVLHDFDFNFFSWRWLDSWTLNSYEAWCKRPYGDYL